MSLALFNMLIKHISDNKIVKPGHIYYYIQLKMHRKNIMFRLRDIFFIFILMCLIQCVKRSLNIKICNLDVLLQKFQCYINFASKSNY